MPPTIPEQYWQLTPVGETFEVDLTMNHYLQPNDQLLLCKIDNPGWDCANDLSSEVTITKLGVTQFNDLALGAIAPRVFMTGLECGNVSAWTPVLGLC